jgi:hypothetical protein
MAKKKTEITLEETGTLALPGPTGKTLDEYDTHVPTPDQFALFAADVASSNGMSVRMAAVLNLLEDILVNPDDLQTIRRRLRDRDDVLDFVTLFKNIRGSISEQTAFPTQQESDSESSPSTTGKRSTGRVQAGE